jgi:hypothetical protein
MDRIPSERCKNELHVRPWSLKRMKPCNSLEVRNMMFDPDEEIKNGTSGEWIANAICVGDNVAIINESETDEQF